MKAEEKKVKPPTPRKYHEAKVNLALECVDIRPCKDCGWPVYYGYCCRTCGSQEP